MSKPKRRISLTRKKRGISKIDARLDRLEIILEALFSNISDEQIDQLIESDPEVSNFVEDTEE